MYQKIIIIALLFSSSFVFSQKKEVNVTKSNSWIKAGITAGIPVGDASDFASFNLGLDVRGQYMATPNFGIGIASGYNHFFGKDDFDDFGMIPIAGFIRYYFAEKGLFIGTDLGYGYLTDSEIDGGLYLNPQIGYHNDNWNMYGYFQNNLADDVDIQTVGLGVTYNLRFK